MFSFLHCYSFLCVALLLLQIYSSASSVINCNMMFWIIAHLENVFSHSRFIIWINNLPSGDENKSISAQMCWMCESCLWCCEMYCLLWFVCFLALKRIKFCLLCFKHSQFKNQNKWEHLFLRIWPLHVETLRAPGHEQKKKIKHSNTWQYFKNFFVLWNLCGHHSVM